MGRENASVGVKMSFICTVMTITKVENFTLFKLVTVYPIMVVDSTNMQIGMSTQFLGMYSVKCQVMNTQD